MITTPTIAEPRLRRAAVLVAAAAALALALGSGGCKKAALAATGPTAVPVYVTQAEARQVPLFVDSFGTIEAYRTVTLTPQVSGLLRGVAFTEGSVVKKGQVLYQIDQDTYRQTVDKAMAALAMQQAALQPADDRLRRSQELNTNKLLAPQDYEALQQGAAQAKASVAAAEADLAQAKLNLDRTTVTAPMDGVIGINPVQVGNLVNAQQTALATLREIDPIYVTFSIPGPNVPALLQARTQGAVEVLACTKDDFKSAPVIKGELEVIDNNIDPKTDMMTVKARLPNAEGALWPGEFVRARLILAEMRNAVVVENSAVMIGADGPYVFVVANDKAELRKVTLGEHKDDVVVIKSGVQSGEQIVTQGQLNLRNGTLVRVVPHHELANATVSAE